MTALSRPRVGVVAVQGAVAEHEEALRAVGADPVQVRLPEDLEGLDGIVIPGGESTTFGLVAGRSGLLDALRDAVRDDRMPVLGTCAGMIMLASATTGGAQPLVGGMDIVVRRNAFGAQVRSFEADVDVPELGDEPVRGVFIRAPWIEEAGPDVEVLASYDGHGVAARQGDLTVTAFHPELTGDRRLHARFVARVRERRGAAEAEAEGGARVRAQ
ncbi:MAG: pyridoxal 5'-phosphate synthase glutaminase subunit PdxT [Actinomycetota bacterium]